jgi:hypothetical protein
MPARTPELCGMCRFVLLQAMGYHAVLDVRKSRNRMNAAVLFPGINAILGA